MEVAKNKLNEKWIKFSPGDRLIMCDVYKLMLSLLWN